MNNQPQPRLLDYRNASYQGSTSINLQREGTGLLLDIDMKLVCAQWKRNIIHGDTLVFSSHAKYIYGQWSDGVPHGINVFRSGDTILFANYESGSVVGHFIVIFEKQRLAFTGEINKNKKQCNLLEKKQNINLDCIKSIIAKFNKGAINQKYYSLIDYVQQSFVKTTNIKLLESNQKYFLGFPQGIGIIFDDDNVIKSIGNKIADNWQVEGIGAHYAINNNQEGDFEHQDIVKYSERRPAEVKQIIRNGYKKSMNFINQFAITDSNKIMCSIEQTLKQKIISKIAKTPLEQSRQYSYADFNDSLQYQPKVKNENERLKEIREELYKSISRVDNKTAKSHIKIEDRNIVSATQIPEVLQDQNAADQYISKYSKYLPMNYSNSKAQINPTRQQIAFEDVSFNKDEPQYFEPCSPQERNTARFRAPSSYELPKQQTKESAVLKESNINNSYSKIQQRREKLLKDYQKLRNQKQNTPVDFKKKIDENQKYQSPVKQINLCSSRDPNMTSKKSNTINASSRKFMPVLHQNTDLVESIEYQPKQNIKQSLRKVQSNFKVQSAFKVQPIYKMEPSFKIEPLRVIQQKPQARVLRKFSYLADIEL